MIDKQSVTDGEVKVQGYTDRLTLSRIRLLHDYGFYGLLLVHLTFVIDESVETAATDGRHIYFAPAFLDTLSEEELDIVMMHEVLHLALQHFIRGEGLETDRFNIACDIVVNSNIMLEKKLSEPIHFERHGVLMHKAPNGREGYLYSAEEVYEMLPPGRKAKRAITIVDNHSFWDVLLSEGDALRDDWKQHVINAVEALSVISISNQGSVRSTGGSIPLFAKRLVSSIKTPQIDWRTILHNFIQEEVNDYSFSPPDRRFSESPFFLPDFNEIDGVVKDILFMIDTSGSMSGDDVTSAFSEIYGAVEQWGGRLSGKLGFFDAAVTAPIPFENVSELSKIAPMGGGGTDFQIIFRHIETHMRDNPPVCIIILTDGGAVFPEERLADDIPVLWLLNNEDITPPWGKVARMQSNQERCRHN